MKIYNVKKILQDKNMENQECNFKLIKKGPQAPSWFKSFVEDEFKPAIAELNSRIDNLVKKNNLKE